MADKVQWEYRVVSVGNMWGTKPPELEATLNQLGLEGWEIIHVYNPYGSGQTMAVAKRLIDPSVRRRREWDGT